MRFGVFAKAKEPHLAGLIKMKLFNELTASLRFMRDRVLSRVWLFNQSDDQNLFGAWNWDDGGGVWRTFFFLTKGDGTREVWVDVE